VPALAIIVTCTSRRRRRRQQQQQQHGQWWGGGGGGGAAREVIDDVCFTGPRCACAAFTFANRFPVLFFKVVAVHCLISANCGWDACGVKECVRQRALMFELFSCIVKWQFLWNSGTVAPVLRTVQHPRAVKNYKSFSVHNTAALLLRLDDDQQVPSFFDQ
jgi:hypothetical protein